MCVFTTALARQIEEALFAYFGGMTAPPPYTPPITYAHKHSISDSARKKKKGISFTEKKGTFSTMRTEKTPDCVSCEKKNHIVYSVEKQTHIF